MCEIEKIGKVLLEKAVSPELNIEARFVVMTNK